MQRHTARTPWSSPARPRHRCPQRCFRTPAWRALGITATSAQPPTHGGAHRGGCCCAAEQRGWRAAPARWGVAAAQGQVLQCLLTNIGMVSQECTQESVRAVSTALQFYQPVRRPSICARGNAVPPARLAACASSIRPAQCCCAIMHGSLRGRLGSRTVGLCVQRIQWKGQAYLGSSWVLGTGRWELSPSGREDAQAAGRL